MRRQERGEARSGAIPSGPVALAALVGVVLGAAYLVTVPKVPDLAAQTARAHLFSDAGPTLWWGGWYGALHTPGYSVVAPPLLAALGPPLLGAVSTLASSALFAGLVRGTRRPRLAAVAFAVSAAANLAAGRVTFALGVALALAAVRVAVPSKPAATGMGSGGRVAVARTPAATRPSSGSRVAGGAVLAALAALASPVAGLFLGLAAAATVLTLPGRRCAGLVLGAAAALAVLAVAALFPDPGRMPFTWHALQPSLYASAGLVPALWGPRARPAQVGAVLSLVTLLLAYGVASPVGSNAERLALLVGLPVLLACSPLPSLAVAAVAVPLVVWPYQNLHQELGRARDASVHASYYTPLLDQLAARLRDHAPGRVEVVDPRTHWSSVYVARRLPIARGWERQVDDALNPLFYGRAPLSATTYRAWLDAYAVAFVALPDAPLDFAAAAEGALVRRGLAYLDPVWRGAHWTLYAVRRPAPAASGVLTAVGLDGSGVRLLARAAGTGTVAVHWSPYLTVTTGRGCVSAAGPWTRVRADAPGPLTVAVRWRPLARLRSHRC